MTALNDFLARVIEKNTIYFFLDSKVLEAFKPLKGLN